MNNSLSMTDFQMCCAVNGVTYDDGSTTANAVKTLVRAVKMNGRA